MKELKQIDMSVLEGSDVLCEFWNVYGNAKSIKHLGFLHEIVSEDGFTCYESETLSWDCCKPLLNRWISNAEGNLVLPDGLMVDAAMRCDDFFINGYEPKFMTAKGNLIDLNNRREIYPLAFHPIMEAAQIIAVRITGLADGYCWSKS